MNKPDTKGWFGDILYQAYIFIFGAKEEPVEPVVPEKPVVSVGNETIEESRDMKRFVVGIGLNNYKGTSNDLRGCNNDCSDWVALLKKTYKSDEAVILLDDQATKKNVKRSWMDTLKQAQSGDVVIFTYSGHGTSVADTSGDEADGRDEAICLYDGNMTDDTIRSIFATKKEGVKLVFISDSCHSGTVSRSFIESVSDNKFYSKPKYLPPKKDIDAAYISATPLPKKAIFSPAEDDMNHVLISGCLPTEYSYDARYGRRFNGAMTYNAIKIIKANPNLTYNQFYKALKKVLPSSRYPQTPQLEGSKAAKGRKLFS